MVRARRLSVDRHVRDAVGEVGGNEDAVEADPALVIITGHSTGAILSTSATTNLDDGSWFCAFAQRKVARRSIVQSMARELGPKGVHGAHGVIDNGIIEAENYSRMKPVLSLRPITNLRPGPRHLGC